VLQLKNKNVKLQYATKQIFGKVMQKEVEQDLITIHTPHFGELEISKEHIFHFENGMLGFDNLKDYVLISDEDTDPFKWLISIEESDIGFPLLSPFLIDVNYKFGRDYEESYFAPFVVITLAGEDGNISANMKAPIILNIENLKGEQVILPSEKYSPNHILKINK
jgi:flagellar assembly factor FliW